MNNIKEALRTLIKALPSERQFSDLRYYMLKAVNEVEHIEKKQKHKAINEENRRQPHPMVAQQWKFDKDKSGVVNPFLERSVNAKLAIQAIDEMIKAEQQKLDNMKHKNKPNPPANDGQDYGGIITG